MNESQVVSSGLSHSELEWICRLVLQTFPLFKDREIEASFYPYIGLTHTIRRKGSKWILRISDHCSTAPRSVLEAIVILLASKVLRRRPPAGMVKVYDQFRLDPSLEASLHARRLRKGRKQIRTAQGQHYSLLEIYRELNARYFNNQVDIRQIGWGPRRSWGRLGHYDPVHHTITISPVLDSPQVPKMVVAYIVYHEILHTLFTDSSGPGPKRHHTPEYRRAERAYPDYVSAKKFLQKFCRNRKKSG